MAEQEDGASGGSTAGGDAETPHYLGHRQRLRRRLLEGGTEALPEYELLEFLLFTAQPRSDMKPLAKTLLQRFGSLAGVLSARSDSLLAMPGMGEASVATLKAVREAGLRPRPRGGRGPSGAIVLEAVARLLHGGCGVCRGGGVPSAFP